MEAEKIMRECTPTTLYTINTFLILIRNNGANESDRLKMKEFEEFKKYVEIPFEDFKILGKKKNVDPKLIKEAYDIKCEELCFEFACRLKN